MNGRKRARRRLAEAAKKSGRRGPEPGGAGTVSSGEPKNGLARAAGVHVGASNGLSGASGIYARAQSVKSGASGKEKNGQQQNGGGQDGKAKNGKEQSGKAQFAKRQAARKERSSRQADRTPIVRTRRFMWGLLASGWAFAVAAVIIRGQDPEQFMAILLSGIMIIGIAPWIAASAAGLEAARTLSRPEADAGGQLTVTLTLRARLPLPLQWVSIRERLANESGGAIRTVHFHHIGLPWRRREWRVVYTIKRLERGRYMFGDIEAAFGDAFGLTAVKLKVPVRDGGSLGTSGNQRSGQSGAAAAGSSFLVLPKWEEETAVMANPGRAGVNMPGNAADALPGGHSPSTEPARRPSSAAGHRTAADASGAQRLPYRPGDDPRRVDWRAASRGGIWVTKRERTVWPPELLVAIDRSFESYGGSDRIFDRAAGYAAAIVRQACAAQIPFRLLGAENAGAELYKGIPAAAHQRRTAEREALERLAVLQPHTSASPLDDIVDPSVFELVPRGAELIVVTSEWRSAAFVERLAALAAAYGWRAEAHVLTEKRVPTLAMRERRRDWESAGVKVVWVTLPDEGEKERQAAIAEGGEDIAFANG